MVWIDTTDVLLNKSQITGVFLTVLVFSRSTPVWL